MELLGKYSDVDTGGRSFSSDECIYFGRGIASKTSKLFDHSHGKIWSIAVDDSMEKAALVPGSHHLEGITFVSAPEEDPFSRAVKTAFAQLQAPAQVCYYFTGAAEPHIDLNWQDLRLVARGQPYELWDDPREELSRRQEFEEHARKWSEETAYASSATQIILHPSYQRIIGMGKSALPFIFRDLQGSDRDWFWALASITGENPVSPHDAGNVPEMSRAWLNWGRRHHYV
jgi:hypothetical protein